jgi:hypothetical protein
LMRSNQERLVVSVTPSGPAERSPPLLPLPADEFQLAEESSDIRFS